MVSASESHMAFIVTHEFTQQMQNLFLSAFTQELTEVTMSDLEIKQKSEHQRLQAKILSLKVSGYDFT